MIRAVLFDVANVIVPWDPYNLFDTLIPDAAAREYVLRTVITRDWHERHDAGIRFADNRADLIAKYPAHEAHIVAWGDRFLEMFGAPFAGTVRLIKHLHARGVPLFGLTNMPLEVWDDVKAMSPAFDLFKDIIVSGREGVIKPSPEIFAIALERMQLSPDEVLFIDDTAVNIEAAKSLGFRTHLFTSPEALATDFIRQGLIKEPANLS
jgi:2-haloacid dehalogenase